MKTVLNAGAGDSAIDATLFPPSRWKEIRLDADPSSKPDIVASLLDLGHIGPFDAVYSSDCLEHLYFHEVPIALNEIHRVLVRGGAITIKVPDLQLIAGYVALGHLEGPLYDSPAGPITALDVLYGFRPAIEAGYPLFQHKTGFTAATLGARLVSATFVNVSIRHDRTNFALIASAVKA